MKVWNQTLLAPMVTSLLFLAIFTLAIGRDRDVGAMPFIEFITPGLIMMTVVQNPFANSSSSLMLAKIQGVIIDILMPPLSPFEINIAYLLGGITRGVLVGLVTGIAMQFFVPYSVHAPVLLLFYVIFASSLMAQLGLLAGIWAQSFDQMSAITNYIVAPLAFLSGTFYSVRQLPDIWYVVSQYNPFFYMIDGVRYAITGYSDGDISVGLIYLLVLNVILWCATTYVLKRGYRLKS